MATKRNRIMYASQSLRVGGHLVYRVQTLGANTTFTAENIFELGHLDIVDVVDDVPAVAVTIDTHDFGAVEDIAVLAGMNPKPMIGTPTSSGAYLRTNTDCTHSGGARYYHGIALADFTLSNGVAIWAPIQSEASLGTLNDDIEMTLFMDKVYVNNMTMTYNVGANAAANFTAETDNKMWLMNGGKFVSQESWELASGSASSKLNLGLPASATIPQLSNCKLAFLSFTAKGAEGVIVKESADRDGTVYPVVAGTVAAADSFVYKAADNTLFMPSNAGSLWSSKIKVIARYAASQYAAAGQNTTGGGTNATDIWGKYFENVTSDSAPDFPKEHYPEHVGALRQGQVEIYLFDPASAPAGNDSWDMQLRLQTCDITATPTRTPLNQLGHFRPYARPMNFPVEITTRVTTIASDLETFATFAGKDWSDYEGGTDVDLTLTQLMTKKDLCLVVKVYQQTDEEAGGTGFTRKAMIPALLGESYFDETGAGTYASVGSCSAPDRERPLKTIIVPNLIIMGENYQNAVGGGRGGGTNATQEFNFRSTNELFVVKGEVDVTDVACLERNTSAVQY